MVDQDLAAELPLAEEVGEGQAGAEGDEFLEHLPPVLALGEGLLEGLYSALSVNPIRSETEHGELSYLCYLRHLTQL